MVLIGGVEEWATIQWEKSMWMTKRSDEGSLVTMLIGKGFSVIIWKGEVIL
jgi:hypothetical protein